MQARKVRKVRSRERKSKRKGRICFDGSDTMFMFVFNVQLVVFNLYRQRVQTLNVKYY